MSNINDRDGFEQPEDPSDSVSATFSLRARAMNVLEAESLLLVISEKGHKMSSFRPKDAKMLHMRYHSTVLSPLKST